MRSAEQCFALTPRTSHHLRSASLGVACVLAGALIATLPVYSAPAYSSSEELASKHVLIDYIAHASFQLTSPEGTRVVLDPFNDHIWLGYQFPKGLEADLVLVSHPHYDHDASYSVNGDPVVFRHPVKAQFNGVTILGAKGRHSEPYGKEFGQRNTVWKVEMGGLSLVHWGDNGPITHALASELGNVDVLFLPIDGDQHILKDQEVDEILRRLNPGVLIPMHYKIPNLSTEPRSLGPIGPWLDRLALAEAKNETKGSTTTIRRSKTSRLEVEIASLPQTTEVFILEPDRRVTAWPGNYRESLSLMNQALEIQTSGPNNSTGDSAGNSAGNSAANSAANNEASIALLETAVQTYSRSIRLWRTLAQKQLAIGRANQAISTLETGLIRAARDDWTSTASARVLLGELYERQGYPEQATEQFTWVLDNCANLNFRSHAEAGLAKKPSNPR